MVRQGDGPLPERSLNKVFRWLASSTASRPRATRVRPASGRFTQVVDHADIGKVPQQGQAGKRRRAVTSFGRQGAEIGCRRDSRLLRKIGA